MLNRLDYIRQDRQRRIAAALRRRHVSASRTRRRKLSRRRKVGRVVLLATASFTFLGMVGSGAVYATYQSYVSQLPDAAALAASEPPLDTRVYASDGTLITIFSNDGIRHEHASLTQINRYAQQATIDTEDRHFYSEASFDIPRMAASAWTDLRHSGGTQGASTITEQLAKVSFLPSSQTLDRKIKQVILGQEIDASFSKSQILEMYLNRIDYGNHALGIATAADLYFHTTAASLDLAQASMLAGLPQSPTTYDPLIHAANQTVNPLAKTRQKVVLEAMVNNGDITQAQADKAFAEPLTFHSWTESQPNLAPDFVTYLRGYLDTKFGNQYIQPGGWDIYTSLDLAKNNQAQAIVNQTIVANGPRYNTKDAALVALDPTTGEIQAMIGSYDPNDPGDGQLDMAIRPRQPGSSIKLFTYSAAIASRQFTMTSPILDAPITYHFAGGGSYTPFNYDLRFHGNCPLKVCFANSFNVPAIKTEVALGIPYITDFEIDAGLSSLADPANRPAPYQYSATLGALAVGVSPLEMADGAATIADMGVHHDPAPVTHIVDDLTGKTLWTYDPATSARQVMPPDVAFIISEITSNDRNRQPEFPAHGPLTLPDRRVSAKTGTTQFFTDNWTVGWTPQVTTAVWVGNPTPSCLKPEDTATMAHDISVAGGRLGYSGVNITDPFSPQDLAAFGLQPINDHCGHLIGSDGLTGAAPIWNAYMSMATKGLPPAWYTKPADVIEVGTGDNGDFYLPGTQTAAVAPTTGCWYVAPQVNPHSTCTYLGPTLPPGVNPKKPNG